MPPDLIRETQLCVLFCKRYIPQQAWARFQRKLITAVEQKGEAKCFNAGNIPTLLLCCLVTAGLWGQDHSLCSGIYRMWGTAMEHQHCFQHHVLGSSTGKTPW